MNLTTTIFSATVVIVVVIVDIIFATDHVDHNTVSEVLRFWGQSLKIIPFSWGVLAGHFFHLDSLNLHPLQPAGVIILIWLAFVAELSSLVVPQAPMFLYLVLGIVAGMLCWPV